MIDPARTKGRNSADTGWAAWSWVGPKLILWEAGAAQLMPDEIIDLAFRLNATISRSKWGSSRMASTSGSLLWCASAPRATW